MNFVRVFIQGAIRTLADWIYPEKQCCLRCQMLIPGPRHEQGLCADCLKDILEARTRKDPGLSLYAAGLPPLDGVTAAVDYQGVFREWIQRLKYGAEKDLAKPMAMVMAQVWKSQASSLKTQWRVPLKPAPWLTPVPLHPAKQAERGFNQSLLLARFLSEYLGYPAAEMLARTKQTGSQAGLSMKDRRRNVHNVFDLSADWAGRTLPKDRLVLLIDDIVTTGETMRSCADVLKRHGAAYVAGYAWAGGRV